MKFELVEPSQESTGTTEPGRPVPVDQGTATGDQDETLVRPVKERMGKAVDGVLASLERLRAQAAEQAMARAHRDAAHALETGAGTAAEAVFRPHRFTTSPGKDDR